MAATRGISVVPGLAKQYSTPLAAAASINNSAPFIRLASQASFVLRFIPSNKKPNKLFLLLYSKYETNEIFKGNLTIKYQPARFPDLACAFRAPGRTAVQGAERIDWANARRQAAAARGVT
nr:hypothetical protein [Pseudomonas sp.]